MTKPTFETHLKTLDTLVQTLERGDLPLEEALKQFEQGVKLARVCQKTLQDAQLKMEKLLNKHDADPDDNV